MHVTDLAEAIAPDVPHDVIGIRPGEKLHEILITSDEARHAIDAGDVYVVLPEHSWWDEMGPSAVGQARATTTSSTRATPTTSGSRSTTSAPCSPRRSTPLRMIDIPYGHQSIDDDDIAAVVDVLRGDWLTQGPAVEQFEAALCAVTGAEHAVAFANGTVALHASLWATGIGKGDTVATSPLSFVAERELRALGRGACPRSSTSIRRRSTSTSATSAAATRSSRCTTPGCPIDLAGIVRRPRVVIEDAAHALGA